jgi:NADP-dependent 3-hydroxy acid dehydrogenase YdfG
MRETTGRNAPEVTKLAAFLEADSADLRTVELDVLSQDSVDAAVAKVIADTGRIDVLVHNAGHMVFGPAEAFTPEQLAQLYDVNVLSTQRVNRAVLPDLRREKQGLVVWVSSSSSAGGTPPYLAPYFAAKAGMDAMGPRCETRRGRPAPTWCREPRATGSLPPFLRRPRPIKASWMSCPDKQGGRSTATRVDGAR